jgi:hypothetical protein
LFLIENARSLYETKTINVKEKNEKSVKNSAGLRGWGARTPFFGVRLQITLEISIT